MQKGFVIGDRGLGAAGDTHPAWMMAHALAGSYLIAGASAVGQIHLNKWLPRDDAFIIRSFGPWIALAVADGVGSRPLSRYGSTYVVEVLTSHLLRQVVPLPVSRTDLDTDTSKKVNTTSVAPPPVLENVSLKPSVMKYAKDPTFFDRLSLSLGLKNWEEFLTTSVSILEEAPSNRFQQAASVGWWHIESPKFMNRNKNDAPPSREPVTASVQPSDASKISLDQNSGFNLDIIMREAFKKTYEGLIDHSRYLKLELADLSCTALALLFNLDIGEGVAGQVGDGAILGLSMNGKVDELIHAPETEDLQSTYTLNRPNYGDYLAVQLIKSLNVDPLQAIYLMTDGLSGDLLYSSDLEALKDWAQKVDRNLRLSSTPAQAAIGMLNWLATYEVTGSWDDRTLVVITRRERANGDSQPASG